MLELRPKALWASWKRQSPAFWALCFYVFIEYVRPQSIYGVLEALPLGLASLLLALVLAPFDSGRAEKRIVPIEPLLWVFSVVLVASIIFGYAPQWGWDGLHIYINWLLLFVLVVRLVNNEERFFLFFLLFMLWSFKMSQHAARSFATIGFGFRDWGATGGPGWFHNSGEFAVQMCVFLPLGVAWILAMRDQSSLWKTRLMAIAIPGTAILGLIASSSRGGQLGGIAALTFLLLRGRRRLAGIASLILIVGGTWLIMPAEQKERFSAMGEDDSSTARTTFWKDGVRIFSQYPVLGIGYESWRPYCLQHCEYPTLPHNVFVEAGAELGAPGLLLFLGLIGGTFHVNARTRRLTARAPDRWSRFFGATARGLDAALVGYLVSGFFVTVLYYPFFWMNLAFTASLHLVTRRHRTRLHPRRAQALRHQSQPDPLPVG